MKLHTQLIAFADYASISQEGKLSIMGIFDRVWVVKFPGGITQAYFVTTVKGESNTKHSLSLKGNLGKENIFPVINVEVTTSDNGQANIIMPIPNFAFPKEGNYEFTISEGTEEIGSTHIDVVLGQPKNEPTYKLPN